MKRILFSSYHNYLDQVSGAAISLRSLLCLLISKGWSVRTLTGSYFDNFGYTKKDFETLLERRCLYPTLESFTTLLGNRDVSFNLVHFEDEGVSSTVFLAEDAFGLSRPSNILSNESEKIFLKLFLNELRTFRPSIYLTYGGYPTALTAARISRQMNIKNVFYLCNFGYNDNRLFHEFDEFIVPSCFSKNYYKKLLNIDCHVIPPLIDETKIFTSNNTKQYLTFINPSPEKGLFFFVGIVKELNRVRPDIPILVVEGRAKLTSYSVLQTSALKNLHIMENTTDPRLFYSQSRVVIVPSLFCESFGRVVIEASMNKIPVICSNRGALPEIGIDQSCILDIPSRFTPFSRCVPTSDEVAPWVKKIVELWDSPNLRDSIGECAKQNGMRFSWDSVSDQTEDFFLSLI